MHSPTLPLKRDLSDFFQDPTPTATLRRNRPNPPVWRPSQNLHQIKNSPNLKWISVYLESVRHFLDISAWDNAHSATLTCKDYHGRVRVTKEYCSQNLKHFLKVLTRKLLPRGAINRGAYLKVIPALETNASGSFHYHLAVNVPKDVPFESFEYLVHTLWYRTHWGDAQVKVDHADTGWLKYITKKVGHGNFDVIDVQNLNL